MRMFRREIVAYGADVPRAKVEAILKSERRFVAHGDRWTFEDPKRWLTADVKLFGRRKVAKLSLTVPRSALHGDDRDAAYVDVAKKIAEQLNWELMDDGNRIDVPSAYDRAAELLEEGRYEDAIPLFKLAIEQNSNELYAWHNLGHCYEQLDRNDEALETFRALTKKDPKSGDAWAGVGNALSGKKKYKEALAAHDKAIAVEPKLPLAWINSGFCLNMLGKHDEAMKRMRKAQKLDPDDAFIDYNIACTFAHLRKREECLAALKAAFTKDRDLMSAAPKEPELAWMHGDPGFKKLCR